MKCYSLLLIGLLTSLFAPAQNQREIGNPWRLLQPAGFEEKVSGDQRLSEYACFQLDHKALLSALRQAPVSLSSLTKSANSQLTGIPLFFPRPDGTLSSFRVFEAPVLHPLLEKKFPDLKSYAGTGIEEPSIRIRFDISTNGFHGMILSDGRSDILIDPLDPAGNACKVYFKKAYPSKRDRTCYVQHSTDYSAPNTNNRSPDCLLRVFRLAVACTGEYAQYHGGTTTSALAAIHTTITRVNGILERDLSVSLQLVPENDKLLFLNPFTDPYSNHNTTQMMKENQETCDDLIGTFQYDIGHVFSTGTGGIALVGSVCKEGEKASAVSGGFTPEGDPFDIDYVAHEFGHQLGANHTQNNDCNRYKATSVEPGSGSTIMGYAGVCDPNVQVSSDAYFHAISLGEIAGLLSSGAQCAAASPVNDAPLADAGPAFTIPRSTPFRLSGKGSDDAGQHALTFCWEQLDNQVAVMPPDAFNTTGPLFRSFPPSTSRTRFFPGLPQLVNGQTSAWEVLPAVGRTMQFSLTVRDNQPLSGCADVDETRIDVDGNTGPFEVTGPTTTEKWKAGEWRPVTWNEAGTRSFPVSCEKVDILLSLDGGFTWPVTLAEKVDNDGQEWIPVPAYSTSRARIMVQASDNIFFAISKGDFVMNPSGLLSVTVSSEDVRCQGEQNGSATAHPAGGNGAYVFTWNNGSTERSLNNLNPGTYAVTVSAGAEQVTARAVVAEPTPVRIQTIGMLSDDGTGSVTAVASGGNGDFSYYWNDGSTTPSLKNLLPGLYQITVSDEKGCSATESIQIGNGEAGNEPEEKTSEIQTLLNVYPNPAAGQIDLAFYQKYAGGPRIIIADMLGRILEEKVLLHSNPGFRNIHLDIQSLNPGCYALQLKEEGRFLTTKFIKHDVR